MRVTCSSIAEFLECLSYEKKVLFDTIRFSTIRKPLDGTNRSATKFEVVVQASAVVAVDEDAEYLLEAGESCGKDYHDADASREGSDTAQIHKRTVEEFAAQFTPPLKVLPGVIGL